MIEASRQDGAYPRPQMIRNHHYPLDVLAGFAYDDSNVGCNEEWHNREDVFNQTIQLPFAPESSASGIGTTGYHPVVWYRLTIDRAALTAAGLHEQGECVLLHFGAVDYSADVWVDGTHVARHDGGQTPFSTDITAALTRDSEDHVIVVRAEDDPLDTTLPRGKQDWLPEPHRIWYHRQTGIWRTVWLETVPQLHVTSLGWLSNSTADSVQLDLALSHRPDEPAQIDVLLSFDGTEVARHRISVPSDRATIDIALPAQRNGQHADRLLWSPANPCLLDAKIVLISSGPSDVIFSYFGLRSVTIDRGQFMLNDRPMYLRSVLEQGYWPTSHYTPPSWSAMREEVELILSLGFNAARIHQKVEDPRFLYWCDRLGLMIWGETASAYEFNALAVRRLISEWCNIVDRDRSHPCIVTWVPLNESWGVQHAAHDAAQRAYSLALTNLTRALDPSRPVLSNDGWEHTDSDMWTLHDYEADGEILRRRYGAKEKIDAMIMGVGPAGRRVSLLPVDDYDKPLMLTEFGGISFSSSRSVEDSWGYSEAVDVGDYQARLEAVLDAVNASSQLAGFCYTQLTDTRQETNGLCDENRRPKLPIETIEAIVRGA